MSKEITSPILTLFENMCIKIEHFFVFNISKLRGLGLGMEFLVPRKRQLDIRTKKQLIQWTSLSERPEIPLPQGKSYPGLGEDRNYATRFIRRR